MTQTTRQSIDERIDAGEYAAALGGLRAFYAAAPTLANAQFVLTRMPRLAALTPRVSARVAIVRSFTIEPVVPLLRASAALYGLDLGVKVGEFNTYAQEMLSPAGFLTDFDPGIVVVAVQTRDLLPGVWSGTASDGAADCDGAVAEMRSYVAALRARSTASIVIQNFEQPAWPSAGAALDAQRQDGQAALIRRANEGLAAMARETTGVHVLDYDGLVARNGRARWRDEQKWLTARMPIAADCLAPLAGEYLRFLLPLTGRVGKALVCDLDNTLWGGVIGEDGMTGIQLDSEYPGAAYQALQRAILSLYERGIILAVASKNNSADAMQAIDEHPGMILRARHFSSLRINWSDKAQSVREIAQELNIGIDSIAFLDDNPVERQRVAEQIPAAHVIDLPDDPLGYADALRACPLFERLTLSSEDRERGRYYAQQRQRSEMEKSTGSVEDFYRSLAQTVEVLPATDATLARVAQLTGKTNQFNLTTRRYTEADIAAMMQSSEYRVLSVRVQDKFGDNGIVGVVIVRFEAGSGDAELDTFLLSCRVIGRTVETAILSAVLEQCRQRGAGRLWGWFLPTAKNAPAKAFFADHGFSEFERPEQSEMGEGATAWARDLAGSLTPCPEWITLIASTNSYVTQ